MVNLFKKIRAYLRHIAIGHLSYEHEDIKDKIDKNRFLLGKIHSNSLKQYKIHNIHEAEFQVYSQFGQDGIIQFLIQNIPIPNKIFVDIGCGNFEESNTRFLLENNNWTGLAIDKEPDHIKFLTSNKGKYIKYAYDIDSVVANVDPSNVNDVIEKDGVTGDIGLLSIDIDGMDYFVLEKIKVISPRIIIIEYNSTFGSKYSVTIPYSNNFDRADAHYSNLYFGSSINALIDLAKKKKYTFVGCNSTGNDAFFVRNDVMSHALRLLKDRKYVASMFHESKDKSGNPTYITAHSERLKLIANMKIINLHTGKIMKCSELL